MVTWRLGETVRRRLRTGQMLLPGRPPAAAAHAVGMARQTAYTRKVLLDEGGIDALRPIPTRRRPARLDGKRMQVLGCIWPDKATENGFGTELTTRWPSSANDSTASSSECWNAEVFDASRHCLG